MYNVCTCSNLLPNYIRRSNKLGSRVDTQFMYAVCIHCMYVRTSHTHALQLLSFYSAVTSNTMYANVEANTMDDNCTLRIQCVSEDFNEFRITVTQSGTTILPRTMIDCNASVPVEVPVEEQSMLPREFDYEIEVMIGEDINVILLGGFVGSK